MAEDTAENFAETGCLWRGHSEWGDIFLNGILQAVQKALEKAAVNTTPIPQPTAVPQPEPTTPTVKYKDGVYTGNARGYSGIVTITATVKDGKITELSNTNSDTGSYFRRAWRVIQPAILEKQTADGIDTVNGATFSSEGISEEHRKR